MRIFNSLRLQLVQTIPAKTKSIKTNLYLFSSVTKTPTQTPNTLLFNFLIQTLNLPKTEAQSISTRFSYVKSLENRHSVLHYLRSIGFSETDIRSSVLRNPVILFYKYTTLKPKMELFQEMGLAGSHLGKLISNNPKLLSYSLEDRLIPRMEILKKILVDDKNNKDLIRSLRTFNWVVTMPNESRLLNNIAFLESCGIVGSQLSILLKMQPNIFTVQESKLRELVWRVSDMGFSFHSRMFVYGLRLVSCLSEETFERKLELLMSFGFTKHKAKEMLRKAPLMFCKSEEQLKFGLDFFLNKIELKKETLIKSPVCLMFSMGQRVIPRCKVVQILKSKNLLEKEPSLVSLLTLSREKFLNKYVLKFTDHAEELLGAYKGHLLDSPSSSAVEKVEVWLLGHMIILVVQLGKWSYLGMKMDLMVVLGFLVHVPF